MTIANSKAAAFELVTLERWEEFPSAVARIREQYGSRRNPMLAEAGSEEPGRNELLFRGQANSSWSLATTLERRCPDRSFEIREYLECAARHSSEIESFTGTLWDIPGWPELQQQVRTGMHGSSIRIPAYDYLVYLRHHGFPSPLLDWTESPYIAAFFAYAEPGDADRAVFCFVDTISGAKGYIVGSPTITSHGPFVRTDKRHFAQKARYTTCTRYDSARERAFFCHHEEATSQRESGQDILIKIVLPAADRVAALRSLSDFNITHFTLFQSEDSLVATIASRVFDLDG